MKQATPTRALRAAVPCADVRVACNVCGGTDRQPYCEENGLNLAQCESCGFIYVYPQPALEVLHTLYSETYFQNSESAVVGYADYIADEQNIRRTARRRLKRLRRYVASGRLLDVGCATGFFLDEARSLGWKVEGVDISAFGVKYARERFSLEVHHGELIDLPLPEDTMDLVTMWDVIEHVPDPAACIQRAAQLLRPGGYLSLATPDVSSLPARLTGKRWVGYKLSTEHVSYFSRRTLTMLLETAGFEVVGSGHIGKHVSLRLFRDRFALYFPRLARGLGVVEEALGASTRALYINPLDIVQVTARLR